jgi:hypothetical protein
LFQCSSYFTFFSSKNDNFDDFYPSLSLFLTQQEEQKKEEQKKE